jgi:5-methylcytosine-specific restriction endonuclease McrA
MLDEYLEKHSPHHKNQRRNKRKATEKSRSKISAMAGKATKKAVIDNKRSRHIPKALQDKIFTRDKGRCTYRGTNGVRCNSTWNLHIDHRKPYAMGGDHSVSNLRLLCAKHNQLEAERIYGNAFMERRLDKTKPMRE